MYYAIHIFKIQWVFYMERDCSRLCSPNKALNNY